MKNAHIILGLLLVMPVWIFWQSGTNGVLSLIIVNEHRQPISGATVSLLKNGTVIGSMVAGEDGRVVFSNFDKGEYSILVSSSGYHPQTKDKYMLPGPGIDTVGLLPLNNSLLEVTVLAHTLPVEWKWGKTVVNVDASVTNTGSTILEVLERSPGVTVDRNGGITLNGKAGVLVMIDDRPTYLSGEDLNNMLSSMSASQAAQIELIPNLTAQYDAAGGAGIINIRTKKSRNDGFNGSITTSYGQGVYPKNNNSLVLNYRKGRANTFFNYSYNVVKYLTDLYAYRQRTENKKISIFKKTPVYE
jgi:iron complex outermembrane receptor protein